MIPLLAAISYETASAFSGGNHSEMATVCASAALKKDGTALFTHEQVMKIAEEAVDVDDLLRVYDRTQHCDREPKTPHQPAFDACNGSFVNAFNESVTAYMKGNTDASLALIGLWMHTQADFYSHSTMMDLPQSSREGLEACFRMDPVGPCQYDNKLKITSYTDPNFSLPEFLLLNVTTLLGGAPTQLEPYVYPDDSGYAFQHGNAYLRAKRLAEGLGDHYPVNARDSVAPLNDSRVEPALKQALSTCVANIKEFRRRVTGERTLLVSLDYDRVMRREEQRLKFVADFNGDGDPGDIARQTSDYQWEVQANSTLALWPGVFGNKPADETIFVGNFDSSASPDDLIIHNFAEGKWFLGLSTGSGFNHAEWSVLDSGSNAVPFGTNKNEAIYIADFDNNGLSDIARHKPDGTWFIGLSDGARFNMEQWETKTGGVFNPFGNKPKEEMVVIQDFNSDGRADILIQNTGTNEVWVASNKSVTGQNYFEFIRH